MAASAWLARLRARADRPPAVPRVPLWWADSLVGSVEPGLFTSALPAPPQGTHGLVEPVTRDGEQGWLVLGDLTDSLAQVAIALRESGHAHAWRNEQLPVTDPEGALLGTVERGVVRQLGITTFAVHLAGRSPDGRHWVQQRSLAKPNDPGLWDTLMGGMVPATDTLEQALERETWEEAGLRIGQLHGLVHGGRIPTRRPSGEGRGGYVVELIDWYRCVVPDGVAPVNQDGEVERFELVDADELAQRLLREQFTAEAALVLAAAGLVEG